MADLSGIIDSGIGSLLTQIKLVLREFFWARRTDKAGVMPMPDAIIIYRQADTRVSKQNVMTIHGWPRLIDSIPGCRSPRIDCRDSEMGPESKQVDKCLVPSICGPR